MAEQIIRNIVRPEVGIGYTAETPEAGLTDRLAAAELSLITLAEHIRQMRATLGLPCPQIVADLAGSRLWQNGM